MLGNGGPISIPPSQKLEIGRDGTISIVPLGEDATTLAIVDQIKLVNPPADQLEKRIDGLIHYTGKEPVDASGDVMLVSGSLETSNVNPIDALVQMIELSRQFELQVKMMKTVEENSASGAQLMRMA